MPIFELDEGRPRLVQPMQPLAGSFAQEAAALLTHHLAAIAGEPLFAVRSRTTSPDHADLPALLALDATGRPVVLEVGQVLDDDAIVSALRHAGSAARMTTTDLARAYHPDPSRFAVDFAAFREQAAFGAQSTRREGVRLILLCSEVAAEAGYTLSFLRGPGRHVDVLQIGVVRGEDERRLLDVSPLATHEGARRSVEPTALRLVRASEGFAGPTAPAAPRKPSQGDLRSVTPPPPEPASITEPTPIVRRAAPAVEAADESTRGGHGESDEPTRAPDPAATVVPVGTADPISAPGPVGTPGSVPAPPSWTYEPDRIVAPQVAPTVGAARSTHEAPATLTPVVGLRAAQEQTTHRHEAPASDLPATEDSAPPARDVAGALAHRHAEAAGTEVTRAAEPAETSDGTQEAEQVWAELARAAHQPLRPSRPVTRHAPLPVEHYGGPERFTGSGVPLALPELATLAKSRRAVTTLVWVRERRGQRIEATLRSDGLIELPTGEIYADPDAAASVSVASENPVDGWRAWRLGEGGPTLAEATGIIRP